MFVDEIRKALDKSDRTLKAIADETGIHRVNLSKFKAGKVGFPVETLERLAKSLGLKIIVQSKK